MEVVQSWNDIILIVSWKSQNITPRLLLLLTQQFNSNEEIIFIAVKAFMVLPALILQKPSITSKSKEHSATIERRLNLWRQGNLDVLLKEASFIKGKFVKSKKARTVEGVSKFLRSWFSKES